MDENLNTQERTENPEQVNQNQPVAPANPEETQEQPKDYAVIALDQETQDLGVVSGMNENGKLKTIPPDSDPKEFMKVDQHLNPIENFMKNFWFQFNDDRKFKYYRVPSDDVQESAKLIKDTAQNPEQVDKRVKEMATSKPFHNENNIDKEAMAYLGWSDKTFSLEDWDKMIRNEMTSRLYFFKTKLYGADIQGWARVGMKTKGDDQKVNFDLHTYSPKPYLKKIFEHETSVEDQINLLTTGNMGRIVMCKYGPNGEEFPGIISLDRLTNEPKCMRAENIRIPDVYRGSIITPENKNRLAGGEAVFQENMQRADGSTYDNWIQMNADFKGLTDVPNRQMQRMELGKILEDPKTYVPLRVGGRPLLPIQRAIVANGGTVLLLDVKDKTGFHNYYYKQIPDVGFKIFNQKNPENMGMAKEVEESLKSYIEKLNIKTLSPEEIQNQTSTVTAETSKEAPKQVTPNTEVVKEDQKQTMTATTDIVNQDQKPKNSQIEKKTDIQNKDLSGQKGKNKQDKSIDSKNKLNRGKNKGQRI